MLIVGAPLSPLFAVTYNLRETPTIALEGSTNNGAGKFSFMLIVGVPFSPLFAVIDNLRETPTMALAFRILNTDYQLLIPALPPTTYNLPLTNHLIAGTYLSLMILQ